MNNHKPQPIRFERFASLMLMLMGLIILFVAKDTGLAACNFLGAIWLKIP